VDASPGLPFSTISASRSIAQMSAVTANSETTPGQYSQEHQQQLRPPQESRRTPHQQQQPSPLELATLAEMMTNGDAANVQETNNRRLAQQQQDEKQLRKILLCVGIVVMLLSILVVGMTILWLQSA
jgi:hypothetical protein